MRGCKATVQAQHHDQSGNLSERIDKLQQLQEKLGHVQHSAMHKILHLRAMRHGRKSKRHPEVGCDLLSLQQLVVDPVPPPRHWRIAH